MSGKFYCYVDETGQHTKGDFFIVSIILLGEDRDLALSICEEVEKNSRKGALKWIKCRDVYKYRYMELILCNTIFKGRLNFCRFQYATNYSKMTIDAIIKVLNPIKENKVTILIDGLPRTEEKGIGVTLRKNGFYTRKVRGIRKDENDALIRLADAVCGLLNDYFDGQENAISLYEKGCQEGYIIEK